MERLWWSLGPCSENARNLTSGVEICIWHIRELPNRRWKTLLVGCGTQILRNPGWLWQRLCNLEWLFNVWILLLLWPWWLVYIGTVGKNTFPTRQGCLEPCRRPCSLFSRCVGTTWIVWQSLPWISLTCVFGNYLACKCANLGRYSCRGREPLLCIVVCFFYSLSFGSIPIDYIFCICICLYIALVYCHIACACV